MPALSPALLGATLAGREAMATTANTTNEALHVVCAWPLSGALDMDVYGAFQLCSVGVLAAPVTARMSHTYSHATGSNIIFFWTGLILAGLLSLTVEFFRTDASDCLHDDSGGPISPSASKFQYNSQCGLTCTIELGPHSPLRGGSANNIYVIPAPDRLTFGTAVLLASACCIPAILSLISMWNKVLEINGKNRFSDRNKEDELDEPISGTNGATLKKMRAINSAISRFLEAVQIPMTGAAVLAIVITGERNFFSPQVLYQTEPIASIGQWAPIAGTALAVLGSLYVVLAVKWQAVKCEADPKAPVKQCTCGTEGHGLGLFPSLSITTAAGNAPVLHRGPSDGDGSALAQPVRSADEPPLDQDPQNDVLEGQDAGNRLKVANALNKIVRYIGTASHDRSDVWEWRNGLAGGYPLTPGEEFLDAGRVRKIIKHDSQGRRADGSVSPMHRAQSPSPRSLNGSMTSRNGLEGSSTTPRGASPQSPQSPDGVLPILSPTTSPTTEPGTVSTGRTLSESTVTRPHQRRDTLQVPPTSFHSPTRETYSGPSSANMPEGQTSPTIVISPSLDTRFPADGMFGEPRTLP
ncbi:hypothetical protein A1O3_01482 [Capronia epimyces CBS 606.96]|uniref:Uncharacterized protein n=1 Tax=Capronia epimyces CBS 606.96 TaxID=1182542 RepID=W9YUK2_9EURO|nr:uncharacterized protein A1O3_01482 [Capronia epimyces CBS 606.96]EXJ92926.1 hypothetical protein A1O3_01482 [Capronia epimyces CBS 606.96]